MVLNDVTKTLVWLRDCYNGQRLPKVLPQALRAASTKNFDLNAISMVRLTNMMRTTAYDVQEVLLGIMMILKLSIRRQRRLGVQ